uniref:HIVEP zinc finger 2a n=1 Tax=Oryzias sinensis TaxID=183150 RepID=A0A8C7XR05_9TELE
MDPHDSTVTRQKGSNRDEVKEKIPLQRKWASEPSANTKQNTFCDPEVKHRESLPCGAMRGSTPQQKYPMTGNPVQLLSGPSGVGAIGGPPSADPQGPLTQGFPRGYPYQLGQPYPQHPQTERFLSGAKPQPGLESHAWPFAGQLPSDDPYGHPGHTHLHKAGRFPRQKSPSLPSSFGQYSQSGLEPGEEGYSKKEQKPKKPGKYICHYCGRACAKPSVLKKHIRSHTGERPYPCEPCGFSFKTKSNLYKHRKSHAHAIKAGLVPFSSELAVTHSEDVGQASPVGEGEAPSDGEQSTDTDEEGVEGSTMLMEKHSPIPQISFEANKTVSHHMLASQAGGRSHSLDDSSSSKRLAQRMDEKKVQDSDPSISQSLNLLSPHSKGSTDSGYFSPYDSAELQIGTPNTSAKTYEEIMFGRTWYNRPNSRPRQSMTVGMAAADGNGSLKQQDLDMCEIAEDPSSFKDSLGMSGDAKQYPTGPCQSSTGLLEPPSESGTLIRSRSMPAPVPSNLNTPQGIRGSISFDNMVAPDDVFYPPGQPKLKRQSAFEHPANESHPGEAEGHPHMAKGLASSVGLKITERCPGGPEDIFYNQHPSRVSISEIATRKRRKEKSVGDDEDSPENCDSSFSSSVDILGDYDFKQGSFDGSRGTPTGKSSFHSTHSQSDSFDTCVSMCSDDVVPFPDSEGRKPVGNVISVIQHTNSLSRPNSFEKSESFEQPQSDSDLASFSSSSAAASPGQPYHKLVRQPNIQVPEIRVTEEPDKPEKDTEPVVTKEPEKQPPAVEEFQLPQRSDTLSQMPTEKLPPKKKRLRLADMEYSSGESSFESTCTSLSRSPSQESNLSHSSSMSMSFEKDEGVKSVSPTKQVPSSTKQSEFLTVPSSFSSHHQQREMRRSSSEQAPCTLPTELPEMRSKSFDYGSLPSCRQGEVYTSTSAKKERRRGYLVRQVPHSFLFTEPLQLKLCCCCCFFFTFSSPKQSAQQVYDPPLYEEKTEHQSTHIYSPSFPSHINMLSPAPSMLQRHLQPTQNLSSKTTSPGLVVPVRIQTYVPVFGSATYTSVSQFMSSHGNEADALGADRGENSTLGAVRPCNPPGGISRSGFNLSLLLGHTDIDLLCSSFWKGSEKHLNTGIPLSLTSGTISTTDASGSAIGGGKRMLSPTSSLELFIQSKQQKRVKEERMYGQIVKEMSAVELSGAERGTTPEKQGGRNQRAPLRGKDSVDECERMSSSPPLSDPPAATKIAVPVRSSAPHLSDDSPERLDVDDVSPGPSSSPEPMLSSSDADSSDKQALLLKPAPTHSSGMTGGAQSLLFTNLSEVQQLLHFPSLRTTSRVSWCFRNYTKPNSTQAASHCSVYSSWSVSTHNPNPLNISTKAALALLRSKQRENTEWLFTMAAMCPPSSGKLVSSVAWKLMFDQVCPDTCRHVLPPLLLCRYKSNEDYVYVRGRGRGKYICEECGIRCKKPSMLKKHIRTHTDVRPYVCKFCNFAFKTKGNLTKHMKSKAHIKKCLELGVSMSSVEDTEAEEGGRRSHMNLLLLTPASGYAAGVVEGIGGFLGWVTGLLPLEQGSGTYGSFDGHMWLADKSLIILFFSLDQSLSGVMRCQRRAVVAVLGVKTISLLLSIISQSLYQPETCELPCLKLRAPVSEEERAVSGTGSVRKKAGGGLWGQAAGESCRDGKNVKPTARHSLQRVSVCLVPCLHVISLSHIYRTFRPKIPFKVSTPA